MPSDLTNLDALVASPFGRLTRLLQGIEPGAAPIDLSLGEPRAPLPDFVTPILESRAGEFSRYPPIRGLPALREAIADWMGRRYPILAQMIDPEAQLLP